MHTNSIAENIQYKMREGIDFHSHEMQNAAYTRTVTREVEGKAAASARAFGHAILRLASQTVSWHRLLIKLRSEERKKAPHPQFDWPSNFKLMPRTLKTDRVSW